MQTQTYLNIHIHFSIFIYIDTFNVIHYTLSFPHYLFLPSYGQTKLLISAPSFVQNSFRRASVIARLFKLLPVMLATQVSAGSNLSCFAFD